MGAIHPPSLLRKTRFDSLELVFIRTKEMGEFKTVGALANLSFEVFITLVLMYFTMAELDSLSLREIESRVPGTDLCTPVRGRNWIPSLRGS